MGKLNFQTRFAIFAIVLMMANTFVLASDDSIMSPKIGLSFWTIVTFLFVMVVLRFTAWKPLIQSLEKRENVIKDALENAKKAQENAEKTLKEYQEKLANAQTEIKALIGEARKAGEELKNSMLREAAQEAGRIRERSENEIKLAKDKAISEVFRTAADISLTMSSKFIQKSLGVNEQNRIVQETIEEYKNTHPKN